MKNGSIVAAAALAIAALLSTTGCETESADSAAVTISPGYARIGYGQSVTLTASGWDNFSWSVENGHGQLSSTKGKSVVFTAVGDGSASNTCIVTATPITGSSSNSVSVARGSATIEVR